MFNLDRNSWYVIWLTLSGISGSAVDNLDSNRNPPSRKQYVGDAPNTHLLDATALAAARDAIHTSKSHPILKVFFASLWIIPSAPMFVSCNSIHAVHLSISLHQESYKQLQRNLADVISRNNTRTVMSKNLTLPGISKHNYISIGIYNHPCNARPKGCKPYPGAKPLPPYKCNNQTGLPWGACNLSLIMSLSLHIFYYPWGYRTHSRTRHQICRAVPCDGIRNPSAIKAGDAPAQEIMVNDVVHLALGAYYANNSATCTILVQKAVCIIKAWFLANATAMLPNLFYGQICPKNTSQQKGHGGFIEWAHTAYLLDHLQLLRFSAARDGVQAWDVQFDTALQRWWRTFELYVHSPEAQGERLMTNNHGSWYDATWLSIALFNGNASAAGAAVAEVTTTRIPTQILPDGREWIELQRNVPSGYCQYNLKALTQVADLASSLHAANSGQGSGAARVGNALSIWHFETADGRSLRRAIDWLMPYATNESAWPYPQPERPSWTLMWSVLRRASIAFANASYESAACQVMRLANDKAYFKDVSNLQLPPKYFVDCEF